MNTENKIKSPKILAVIPAKGVSKRLVNKNIHVLMGKPMLAWSLLACNESKYKIETYVSSDSDEILEIAVQYGAQPYKRDVKLCQDNVEKFLVIKDVVNYIDRTYTIDQKPEVVISLQPNSPQIKGGDLDNGIDVFLKSNTDEIFSVNYDLMQNGAFRIMKWDYVLRQKNLSTYCGVVICDLVDVHTIEDVVKIQGV